MKDRLYKICMWLGRKFLALILSLFILLIAGIFKPDKLSQIAPAVVGLYLAFVGGHAATDVLNSKNGVKADAKVENKTTEKENAD